MNKKDVKKKQLMDDLVFYTKHREDLWAKYKDKSNLDPLVVSEYESVVQIIENIKKQLTLK
jgi:phosphoribosyl-AMP cyclohydrolase